MPDAANSTEEFRKWLSKRVDANGSQYQLALQWRIGQGLISKWLHPDPAQRTVPRYETLVKISERDGTPLSELLHMTGQGPASPAQSKPALPPDMTVLIERLKRSSAELSEEQRRIRIEATASLWNTGGYNRGRRAGGRPAREQNSEEHASRDRDNTQYAREVPVPA